MLQDLESIADHSEDIAKKVIMLEEYRNRLSADFVRKICHLGELAQTIFDKAVDCVFTKDVKVSNGLLEMRKVFETESDELMQELPEIPYLRAIVSTLGDIIDKAATFAHLAMNMALEEPGEYVVNIVQAIKHLRTLPLSSRKKT
jgi:phosphate uptake regulator